ncbi:MAG TPA: hypothetical protein VF070_01320 [Streptosporangiaceae bacterium]
MVASLPWSLRFRDPFTFRSRCIPAPAHGSRPTFQEMFKSVVEEKVPVEHWVSVSGALCSEGLFSSGEWGRNEAGMGGMPGMFRLGERRGSREGTLWDEEAPSFVMSDLCPVIVGA